MTKPIDPEQLPFNILQTQKNCTQCKKNKMLDEFYTKGERHSSRCKKCDLKKKKEKKDAQKKRSKACTTRRNLNLENAFVVLTGCPGNLKQINSAIEDYCNWTVQNGEDNEQRDT
jgi:hypothetical protein